ncbi:MAG: hypothetical protein KDD82_00910 [Planctomycetes bacterium]|nr:hypothetical protein [Planctomycetota bacterium]
MSLALPPNPGSPGAASWNQLVDQAVEERFRRARSVEAALASGELVVGELVGFAAGCLSPDARRNAQSFLARTPWALGRVTALVRGARSEGAQAHGGLAAKLLEAARTGKLSDGRREVAAALAAAGANAPLAELAERISTLDDPEAALLEVVQFV